MILLDTFWGLTFLGRMHPLVVHFPIVLILLALGLELYVWRKGRAEFRPIINFLVNLGAFSAVLSTILGLILHWDGYNGAQVEWHERSGFFTTLTAILAVIFLRRYLLRGAKRSLLVFRLALILCGISIFITGHLGGELTHGKGFLTEVLPWNQEANLDQSFFADAKGKGELTPEQLDRLNLEIRAIFAHKCYKCHSTEKAKGELILDTKEGVFTGGENGSVIEVGNSKASELVRRIHLPRSDEEAMPSKGKSLTHEEIALVELWIDKGAHWVEGKQKIFREAPLSLSKPSLPQKSSQSHPVDQWVDAYFESQNISAEEPVSDRLFARRAYLDIIGLLPSPRQLDMFVYDDAPNKRDILIQDLLEDEHNYTQHWLSFWNDILRNDYSGTGFITGGRRQITDWLYQSLHDNKPYDQMVRDLLNPDPKSEGFIKGIRWRGVVNSSQSTEMQAAQNISQSLMGLNLKCASCHDSFVSNLTLEQAYNFANIFADSTLEIHRCDKPTGRFAKAAFIYPELGEVNAQDVKARLEQLSSVITQPQNGRLARTLVNRIWNKLMGRGLIAPVDEMDRLPWSQELLDWLAADFVENGYDIKRLIAQIMCSKSYQLPSLSFENEYEVKSETFVFEGPLRRRLSAEQFADALTQIAAPAYFATAYDPFENNTQAEWIWFREIEVDRNVLPKPGKRWFRYAFELDIPRGSVIKVSNSTGKAKGLEKAELMLSVDHAYSLWLNSEKITQGSDWREVQKIDVRDLLRAENMIAIEAENDGEFPNPAGILMSLQLLYSNGEVEYVNSNTDWLSTNDKPPGDWQDIMYVDTAWKKVRRYAEFNASHWGRLVDFHHGNVDQHLEQARASLVYLDPFMKALGRPVRENVATVRDEESTLLQALTLTNGEFFSEIIQRGAKNWLSRYDQKEDLIQNLYLESLGRKPNTHEMRSAKKLLGEHPNEMAVEDLLWAVFLLPEFQLIY